MLQYIISKNQSMFLLGRLITDDILIAHELCHHLERKTKGKQGFVALNLGMAKAFDRVEWSFLKFMMIELGFD